MQRLKPITLGEANRVLRAHNRPLVARCEFAVAAIEHGSCAGVAVVARPADSLLDDGWTFELIVTASESSTRTTLINAATRAAFAMGGRLLVSDARDDGDSFRAAGWFRVADDEWSKGANSTVQRWARSNPDCWFDGLDAA